MQSTACAERIRDINSRCYEIICELRESTRLFITVELVVVILLERYNVQSLLSLGVETIEQIPVLNLVGVIQRRVIGYVHAYFMNKFRSIKSLHELDMEIVAMLKSFGIPSIVQQAPSRDPNEIDLDDTDTTVIISTFADFGLGSLQWYPLVASVFPNRIEHLLTPQQVMESLMEFYSQQLTSHNSLHDGTDIANKFSDFLCRTHQVLTVQQLGISLSGSLTEEILICSHAINKRKLILEEMKDIENKKLVRIRKECKAELDSRALIRAYNMQGEAPTLKKSKIVLKRPVGNQTLCKFIDRMNKAMATMRPSSPYAPSLSDWNDCLSGVYSRLQQQTENVRVGGKKRKPNLSHEYSNETDSYSRDNDKLFRELLAASAEYMVLSWGDRKQLHKRLEVVLDDNDNDNDNDNVGEDEKLTCCEVNELEVWNTERSGDVNVTMEIVVSPGSEGTGQVVTIAGTEPINNEIPVIEKASTATNRQIECNLPSLCDNFGCTSSSSSSESLQVGQATTTLTATRAAMYEGMRNFVGPNANQISEAPLLSPFLQDCQLLPNWQLQIINLNSHQLREIVALMPHWTETVMRSGLESDSLTTQGLLSTSSRSASDNQALQSVGRWGEHFVYHLLKVSHPQAMVQWVNEHGETRNPFDFILTHSSTSRSSAMTDRVASHRHVVYIEVKSTRFAYNNVMELSYQEWEFLSKLPAVQYCLIRVFNVGKGTNIRVSVVPDLLAAVKAQRVRLCIGL